MKYRIDLDADGNMIYIPVPPETMGQTVYNVDMGSDGNLTHTPTDKPSADDSK